jgi:non-heme chloroperoxidase
VCVRASYAEAHAHLEVFAKKSVGPVADHVADVIEGLDRKPIVIGHSFGGLLAQIIAGRGLAIASVSIDPVRSRGVLPLPFSALKASFPVLGNPANYGKAVTLTFDQFRYGFANAVSDEEAHHLYETFHVAAPGRPLFQAATANIDFTTEARADKRNPGRGPMVIISGGKDHIVAWKLANAAFKQQQKNSNPTEIEEIPGVGHSLVIDSRWPEVAKAALTFLEKHGATAA